MKRPLGLTIIAWLAIVGGALQVLGSLGLVGVGSFGILIGSMSALEGILLFNVGISLWIGVILMAFGAVGLIFGFGVMAMRPWSWTMGIIIYALNLVAGLVLLFYTGFGATTVFVCLLSAIVLGYLMAPSAREALGHAPGGGISPQAPHPA
jgi:hypothetical protein